MVRFLRVDTVKNIVVGSHKGMVVLYEGNYTPNEDDWFIICAPFDNDININLPPARTIGVEYIIHKEIADNKVDINADGSDTIDGDATITLNVEQSTAYLICDGVQIWHRVV